MDHPNRGEVWLIDLRLAAKVRPCLVFSIPYEEEDRSLVTAIAHTTSTRSSRFEVTVRTGFLRSGVFDAQNIVTIPRAKLLRKLGNLKPSQMTAVETVVRLWLGL
jgi:mRNA interferase MazF